MDKKMIPKICRIIASGYTTNRETAIAIIEVFNKTYVSRLHKRIERLAKNLKAESLELKLSVKEVKALNKKKVALLDTINTLNSANIELKRIIESNNRELPNVIKGQEVVTPSGMGRVKCFIDGKIQVITYIDRASLWHNIDEVELISPL